jgi:hypothetical protein
MKQLTLTGITVRDEFENEMPYKATVKATIAHGKGSSKQTTNSATTLLISPNRIDEFVSEFNDLVQKFSRKAMHEDGLVE